jgi:aminoglycoside phosphotransferase (APT) family kinase protein
VAWRSNVTTVAEDRPLTISAEADIDDATMRSIRTALNALNAPELAGHCRVARLSGGASNQNFVIATATGKRYVLRLTAGSRYASRFGLDRWRGLEAHRAAFAAGVAPRLCAITLPDGHSLVEFVDRPVVDERRLREPGVLEACTRALRKVHHAGSVSGRFSGAEDALRYRSIAQEEGLPLPDDVDGLFNTSRRIESVFETVGVPERLCHNDVQLPNFLDDATGTSLVDWEYAGQGNPYFDLAMIASNGTLTPAEVDRMLVTYFGKARLCDRARIAIQQFQTALREAMWSVVAKPILGATGWDYDAWANLYFDKARVIGHASGFEQLLHDAGPDPRDSTFLGIEDER